MKRAIFAVLLLLLPISVQAETPEEWITLGARVHGAFGAFIHLRRVWPTSDIGTSRHFAAARNLVAAGA